LSQTSHRKGEHLKIALLPSSQTTSSAGWDDIHLLPVSLPELNLHQVDTSGDLAGASLAAPFVIASMTGGHPDSIPINERLAAAAQKLGVAVGSGSQRAALRDPSLARTYTVIRESAPDAVVLANIGVCQLVEQGSEPPLSKGEIELAIGMLDAQFLIIHLNILEELVQPEGDSRLTGLVSAIESVVHWSPVPVVVKETGSGMTTETARLLDGAGVRIIDVGGAGGTSFSRIEGQRALERGDLHGARMGETFGGWGVPTAASVLEVKGEGLTTIATGGIRTGLDGAKALALGADAIGIGKPVLSAAVESYEAVVDEMSAFIDELRIAMLLTGCATVAELRRHRPIVGGKVREWTQARGLVI